MPSASATAGVSPAGAVVVSVLDAWLRFPAVDAGAGPLPGQRSALDTADGPAGSLAGGAGAASRAAGGIADSAVHVGLALRF